ncbi:MAG: VOC family protein [Acidimicrobiales bacterium]
MARRVQVTFDAGDPHSLCRWWVALLGYEVEDHHDFVARLLEEGAVREDQVVTLDGRLHFADGAAATDREGGGPRLYFQRVPEAKLAKNRVHLDVPVDAERLDAEVERVQGLGATLVGFGSHPGHRWAVMADPEGNEFCIH